MNDERKPHVAEIAKRISSNGYECPTCQRIGRFNSRFVGSMHVVCDGRRFVTIADTFKALRAAGVCRGGAQS